MTPVQGGILRNWFSIPQPADLVLERLTATPPADLLWTRLETTVNGTHVIDLGNRVPVFQSEEVARRQPQL